MADRDIVERLREALRKAEAHPVPKGNAEPVIFVSPTALRAVLGELDDLRRENFALAAGQCANATGDEGGTPVCAEITRLRAEAANLRTVMVAAAEEIDAHWEAHCDADGYGPVNLQRRLEEGIPSEYGYTAGAFAELKAERDRLRADLATSMETLAKAQALQAEMLKERAALAQPAAPGWQLVPVEPTPEMVEAMARAWQQAVESDDPNECVAEYRAALAAAPQAAPAPQGWRLETGVGGFGDKGDRWVCVRHLESQCGQDFYEDRDPLIFGFLSALAAAPQAPTTKE